MANVMQLEIVTPEAVAYSDTVELVVIPGVQGELGIYPMHIPLMTRVAPGELAVTKAGKTDYLAVGEGMVEVTPEKVVVIVDMAIEEQKIDEGAAQEAMRKAEARLKDVPADAEETAALEAAIAKAIALMEVKKRRRSG
jgi:F-type H+-transporting ATPase subunit epsilon